MHYLQVITLIVTGWVAGAESGSWICVHPVIAKLTPQQQIVFQKGLLKTFGRIMPVLMILIMVLGVLLYICNPQKSGVSGVLQLANIILLISAIITTVFFNVPINISTRNWKVENYSTEWKRTRKLWRFFQGYRSLIFIIVFILLAISLTQE